MAQQRTPTLKLGTTSQHRNITQSQSMVNVSELETHVKRKATVEDINELYAALQGLVPKNSQRETDTPRSCEDLGPSRLRRYHSANYTRRNMRDNNMNLIEQKPNQTGSENVVPTNVVSKNTLSTQRLFASDTEVDINKPRDNERKNLQKQLSLPPACEKDEEIIEQSTTDGGHKKSRFFNFHRRLSKPTTKHSSWRSLLPTLSSEGKKSKKHSNNKVGYTAKTAKKEGKRTPKIQALNKILLVKHRTPETAVRSSVDDITTNSIVSKSEKRIAPDPPVVTASGSAMTQYEMETLDVEPRRERSDTLGQRSDMVQRKISAWYKHAVMETNSVSAIEPLRATRLHENLLTDTEVLCKRNAFCSDTDSFSCGDRNKVSVPRTKVRKTRARRNRRRERARFHSCPNVKLVTKALHEVEKKTTLSAKPNSSTKENLSDNALEACHTTTVKPVEVKLSFGNNLENEEPDTDINKLQNINGRNWLTRQCSKTTISCIRPLQLNLFYSESPSREVAHRSRQIFHKSRMDGQATGTVNPHEFAFKIRRLSSRRRKRRSLKRGQTRLPHQPPFYVPPTSLNPTPNAQAEEEESLSKESGLGSPEPDKRCRTFGISIRDQRQSKQHSESEDSGWASSHRHLASTSDTAIQTDPVIVMAAVSRVRSTRVLPNGFNDTIARSEA